MSNACTGCGGRWDPDWEACPRCGTRKLQPGIYVHGTDLHVVWDELLESQGIEPTPENIERMSKLGRETFAKLWPAVSIEEVD